MKPLLTTIHISGGDEMMKASRSKEEYKNFRSFNLNKYG